MDTSPKKGEVKKALCKKIMLELFGPASAAGVDDMTEEECVEKCRAKVKALLGNRQAERFDHLR
ncbi:hypothetical protein ACWJJH_01810 [Endozoicomonadaceae bacterium StTr2]